MRKSSNVHHFFLDSPCYRAIWLRGDHIFMLPHIGDNIGEVNDYHGGQVCGYLLCRLERLLVWSPSSSLAGSDERNLK